MNARVGIGIDFHRFGENRKLVLGGVVIDYPYGLIGHSDADCLIHAIFDAISGAMGLGDIGSFFPDTDERYKNQDSQFFLQKIREILDQKHCSIENIDCVIICEQPKIMPYVKDMKKTISEILQIYEKQIAIKATTTEQMGFLGRREGIACMAVALIKNKCIEYNE